MHPIDWILMFVPFAAVLGIAVYAKRYARDAVDFLAAGRVAGRYVISVGDVAASLSVITIVANCEATYRAGSAMSFWGILPTLLGMFLSLSGYCVYRWRATRALSFGQFLEMRYNRPFRVFAAVLRNLTEMVANAIGPAIAANFFVYFLGLPHTVRLFGHAVPTFALIVGACILFAMVALWPAGRISLLVTDTVQGMLSYPIFALVAAWIFFRFDWHETMEPVMMNRVPGESFLNPFDIDKLRDFNLFALGVWLMSTVLQRASWFGNDTSSAGRTPHEQKMAGVLGSWRNGYAYTMIGLVTLLVITVMNHGRYVLPGEHGGLSSHVVPWLSLHGWTEGVFRFFAELSRPLNPYVDWSFGFNSGESTLEQALQLFREKLFINSTEIYGLSMVLGMVCTVWFIWGGIRDLIRLFRDLGARVRDASDNGFVRRG